MFEAKIDHYVGTTPYKNGVASIYVETNVGPMDIEITEEQAKELRTDLLPGDGDNAELIGLQVAMNDVLDRYLDISGTLVGSRAVHRDTRKELLVYLGKTLALLADFESDVEDAIDQLTDELIPEATA